MRFTERHYSVVTLCFVILSIILVFKSSQKQSLTIDETSHYFCGLEWWQQGSYTAWPENPVLSRALTGLGPYLNGYRAEHFAPQQDSLTINDRFVFTYQHNYFSSGEIRDRIFWVRIFVLPMFLLSILIVWYWSHRLSGPKGALLATSLYALNPVIMAHSGLATTDITFLASFMILLFALFRWLRNPSLRTGLFLGIGLGLSMLSKFSTIPFLGGCLLISVPAYILSVKHETTFWRWLKSAFPSGLVATVLMMFMIWAAHGFSFGSVGDEPVVRTGIETGELPHYLGNIFVPAPEWFAGFVLIVRHNLGGQMAYAWESVSTHGFWGFYLLAYAIKSPIPFLIITITGIWAILKIRTSDHWEITSLLIIPFVLIFLCVFSNINLGIRHLTVIYAIGVIGGAAGTTLLLQHYSKHGTWIKIAPIAALVLFQAFIAITNYPNYLSYFNAFAGREPGKYLVDSDLDWGQGLFELSDFCKRNHVDTLHFAYFGGADECAYDLPPIELLPGNQPVKGWVAVSEQLYWGLFTGMRFYPSADSPCAHIAFRYWDQDKVHRKYRWLDDHELVAKVGGSIRIYFVK